MSSTAESRAEHDQLGRRLLSDPRRKDTAEEMQVSRMAVVCEKLALGGRGRDDRAGSGLRVWHACALWHCEVRSAGYGRHVGKECGGAWQCCVAGRVDFGGTESAAGLWIIVTYRRLMVGRVSPTRLYAGDGGTRWEVQDRGLLEAVL